jgi:hypothetical protein
MGKFNLTEAAKDVLDASISSKRGGQEKFVATKNSTGVQNYTSNAAVGKIGQAPNDIDTDDGEDKMPNYLKGTPKAIPPGPTPPVGKATDGVGAQIPKNQPQQNTRIPDLDQGDETSYDAIRDRQPGKLAPQKFAANKGANFQKYEQVETEEEVFEEGFDKEDPVGMEKKTSKGTETKTKTGLVHKRSYKDDEESKEKMKEDVEALLSGENLSEEFKDKATTIFEAAVYSRVEEIVESVEQDLQEQFEGALEEIKEELAAKVDDYLNYMVEEWMKENELAIEKGLRSEIVEEFIGKLRNLFIESYIDIPEEKVNVVEELADRVEELEAKLNEEIDRNVGFAKQINEHKKMEAIHSACEGLTQTQVEKIKSLAEGVEFTTDVEFSDKLETLKESYFPSQVKASETNVLNEEVQIEEEAPKAKGAADPLMNVYSQAISKTLSK